MNAELVNHFIEASVQTFKTMCAVSPVRDGKLEITEAGILPTSEIIGVIGLSGTAKGAVMMTMDTAVAMKVVGAFLSEELKETNNDLLDGFAEILNIIAGAAAAKVQSHRITLAIPTVMIGSQQKLFAKNGEPWVSIPMKFPEWGKFQIKVSMEGI